MALTAIFPDPDSGSGFRIRIQIPDPDADPDSGSGSAPDPNPDLDPDPDLDPESGSGFQIRIWNLDPDLEKPRVMIILSFHHLPINQTDPYGTWKGFAPPGDFYENRILIKIDFKPNQNLLKTI